MSDAMPDHANKTHLGFMKFGQLATQLLPLLAALVKSLDQLSVRLLELANLALPIPHAAHALLVLRILGAHRSAQALGLARAFSKHASPLLVRLGAFALERA